MGVGARRPGGPDRGRPPAGGGPFGEICGDGLGAGREFRDPALDAPGGEGPERAGVGPDGVVGPGGASTAAAIRRASSAVRPGGMDGVCRVRVSDVSWSVILSW